jgi:hypothetical protein
MSRIHSHTMSMQERQKAKTASGNFRSLNGVLATRSVAVASEACALSNRASLLPNRQTRSDKDDWAMRTVHCFDRNVEPSSDGRTRLVARALLSR